MLLSEAAWGQVAQCRMRAFFVVADHPLPSLFLYFAQRAEQMDLEHFVAEVTVEAFDVGVLRGLPGWI